MPAPPGHTVGECSWWGRRFRLPRALDPSADHTVMLRFGLGSMWTFLGAVLPQVFSLAAYMAVARILGKNVFGEFGMVQTTAITLTLISTGSLSVAVTKHVSAAKGENAEATGNVIGIHLLGAVGFGSVGFLVLYFCGPYVAARYLNAPHLAGAMQLIGALLLLNAWNGVQVGALFGFEAYKLNAVLSLVRGILLCPFVIGGAYCHGLIGAVLGLILASAACCVANHVALKLESRKWGVAIRYRNCASKRRLLWSFSLPAGIAGVLVMFVNWLGNAALARQANGYGELGVFNAANHWRTAVGFVPTILGQSALPVLSELYASGSRARYRRLVAANVALSAATSVAAALPVIGFSAWIMAAYGAGFSSSSPVLILLVISAVLSACCQAMGYALTSAGRMWWSLGFNSIWALTFILVVSEAVPRWGAAGLAVSYLLSSLPHGALILAYTRRLLRTEIARPGLVGKSNLTAHLACAGAPDRAGESAGSQ